MLLEQVYICIPRTTSRQRNCDIENDNSQVHVLYDVSKVQGKLFSTSLSQERQGMHEMQRGYLVSGMHEKQTSVCILTAASRERKKNKEANYQVQGLYDMSEMRKSVPDIAFTRPKRYA